MKSNAGRHGSQAFRGNASRAKRRAALHGRSTEAEIREILDVTVRPEKRVKVGSALASLGKRFGGLDLKITRDPAPTEPAGFE